MQIGPLPLPIVPATSVAQQAVAHALPQIQALAAAPLTSRAVGPADKTEGGQRTKTNSEKSKGGGQGVLSEDAGNSRGNILNASV
ncbi:MAG: hypothetical protein PHX43_02710 [Alphaproteobacteria bacterium]|nr:hypothetical protein [Alphaproteobacteria bacterium]